MSLRVRLTLLYISLLGGVLLIFGSLVYTLVGVLLLNQVDINLTEAAQDLISHLRVNSVDTFDPRSISDLQTTENLRFQVWGNNLDLQLSRPAGVTEALDEQGRVAGSPVFHNVSRTGKGRLRVLSVPLKSVRGPVGVLQVGMSLGLVDVALSTLAMVLVMLAVIFMVLAGLAAWLVTGQALAPLEAVTRVATQITRADDLQRRISPTWVTDDEVGQLITAFNQTLERLEKLFNTQRRFLADVSHELRTPLTVIKGNIGLLRRLGTADEESLSSIDSEVDRLSRLVGDLLLLAQAESGRLPMMMGPVALDTAALEAFKQISMLAGDKVQIRLLEIDQIRVLGDPDRLKQVLVNLLYNALQHTPAGGQISLALRRDGSRAQIMVSDNGAGIPAEDLPHIFERFYRAEKSRKRTASTGFGLGLSIVYWIVRNHNGTIEVKSEEGKGTTFTIYLPIDDTPESN